MSTPDVPEENDANGSTKSPAPEPGAGATLTGQKVAPLTSRRGLIFAYILIGSLIVLILIATLIPAMIPAAKVIYSPDVLRIFYFIVSAIVATLIFGLFRESDALVRVTHGNLLVQLTGAAAGFAIFFYLLVSGLNPYKEVSVLLLDGNQLIGDPIEVTIATRPMQTLTTSTGNATFAYVPKSQSNYRLFVSNVEGKSWAIDRLAPDDCVDSGAVYTDCDQVEVQLKKEIPCLKSVTISSHEAMAIDTTLDIVFRRLVDRLQEFSPDLAVRPPNFSEKVLHTGLHKKQFTLERKISTPRSACDHAADIAGWFNRAYNATLIHTFVSCNEILIVADGEELPKEEYQQCN
jgi:hypothetical protein